MFGTTSSVRMPRHRGSRSWCRAARCSRGRVCH
jgi:hypothetical protein